jgi:hypothetical protein
MIPRAKEQDRPGFASMNPHADMPNVEYILAGELTSEKQDGSGKKHFTAGQALPETTNTMHRGVTGDKPVELIVFYAGAMGMPLSKDRVEDALRGSEKSETDRTLKRADIIPAPGSPDIHVDGACPSNIGRSAP